ncbi:uncharacterized protein LOC109826732 [Asparagus officinalis]|uniref:uncharacterized protein LOC109826732 n=1 Tax=Asparagus officinalis TaxID=4686 RepID=UPI00098E42C6|nr:uncharacterized protein LOC109826732 [Asparagus officinalis]
MNLSFWNVRGLNRSSKQHLVRNYILQYHLSYIALIETKIKEKNIQGIAKKLAANWRCMSNVRNSGKARILILWDPNILDINLVAFSDQQITCSVKSLDGRVDCFISSIYGFNNQLGRKHLWTELSQLCFSIGNSPWLLCGDFNRTELSQLCFSIGNSPWLLCGDFNTMTSNEEKIGGVTLSDADTKDFCEFIDNNQLVHLKNTGCFFTWNNKQEANARVWSRLDRALVNDTWINSFNSSHVEFLLPSFSDHSPALVSILEDCLQGKKPFRFFNMWTKHANYLSTVATIWQMHVEGYKMFSVVTKLKNLKYALKDINKRHFHNISEQVLRAKQKLETVQTNLQQDHLNSALISLEKESLASYNKLLDCEMSFYQQKARIEWGVKGDRWY